MRLYASGVVTNEHNDVLLVRRDDSRTWAVPGGGVEIGEVPPVAAAREIEEETGVKVLPVRLAALQYRPESPYDSLSFVFRCLIRGGEPRPSPETPQVGFFSSLDLPRPMLGIHKEMLQNSLYHPGGPSIWSEKQLPWPVRAGRALVYGYRNAKRRLLRRPPFVPAPDQRVAAFTMIRNPADQVLWVKRRDVDVWNLPGGGQEANEPPWTTAVRETYEETGLHVRLIDLSGVYSKPSKQEIVFAFAAHVVGGELRPGPEAVEFAYFTPGDEPANALPKHVARVADLFREEEMTLFREQDSRPRT